MTLFWDCLTPIRSRPRYNIPFHTLDLFFMCWLWLLLFVSSVVQCIIVLGIVDINSSLLIIASHLIELTPNEVDVKWVVELYCCKYINSIYKRNILLHTLYIFIHTLYIHTLYINTHCIYSFTLHIYSYRHYIYVHKLNIPLHTQYILIYTLYIHTHFVYIHVYIHKLNIFIHTHT